MDPPLPSFLCVNLSPFLFLIADSMLLWLTYSLAPFSQASASDNLGLRYCLWRDSDFKAR